MKYVELDAVLAVAMDWCPDDDGSVAKTGDIREMLDELESIPAADVRPVILCKDCAALRDGISYCMYWGEYVNDSGYCSYGKKR